jgi:hypothetical protein
MKGKTLKVQSIFVVIACGVVLALVGSISMQHPADASPPRPPVREAQPASPPQQGVDAPGGGPAAISPSTAAQLAAAMDVPTADLLAADLMGSDAEAAGVSNAALGAWFPTEGSTFAILSTGLAADALLPNAETNHSHTLDGLNNSQGNDLVRLHLQLKAPTNANCAAFDFAYYSEEFPEFVGSQYNDTFTAQLNDSSLSINGNVVVAPGNFAFDTEDNVISVNTVFGVSEATGTTYDGVTPLLRASTAIVPGATVDFYLSVQDLGDSVYDSAVFLDGFFWSADPQCATGASVDSDSDGLLDDWETDGLTVSVGGVDEFVDLPAMGADPNHKDVFVEVDWMGSGSASDPSHRPGAAAIQTIVNSFNAAPVSNPDGTTGIHLHVDYGPTSPNTWASGGGTWGTMSHGEQLTHQTYVGTCSGNSFLWNNIDTIKTSHLTPGRAAVFHYNVWAHSLCTTKGETSGISRNAGGAAFGSGASDFIASLGGWDSNPGTPDQQAGTFMHELGHNLGLMHGGQDHDNWKPNYLSVMNYSFQTRGLPLNNKEAHFDYSRYDLPDLNEAALDETDGINVPGSVADTLGTRYFCAMDDQRVDWDAAAVDWNCDTDETDTNVSRNINEGMSYEHNNTQTTLTSWNDWDHLVFTGGAISQPGASVSLPASSEVIDITQEQDNSIPDMPHESRIYLPLVRKNPANSGSDFVNGNFEAGSTGWTQYSSHGWALIRTSFPGSVRPHSGNWAVWLGGDYNDISYVRQQVTVPPSRPYLAYWHWIASEDLCGYDYGGVVVNNTVVNSYTLCSANNTGGWVKRTVNLSAYAGQSVSLQIREETDGSLNSNLFVDDVAFQATASAQASSAGPGGDPASARTKAELGALPPGPVDPIGVERLFGNPQKK